MNSVFVTCVYNSEYITGIPVSDPANGEMRWQRFYKSLTNISRTQIPIIIFTNKGNYDYLNNYCNNTFAHKNFKIIELDLNEFDYYERTDALKAIGTVDASKTSRYAQLVLGKMYMIKYAIDHNIFNADRYFWIDAGLSFQSLFPDRYREGPLGEYFKYSCFNPDLVKRLESFSNEKLFVIVFNSGHGLYLTNENIYASIERLRESSKWYTVGGLWGGQKQHLLHMYELYRQALFTVIDSWEKNNTGAYRHLFYEEPIFSAIVCNNPENFHVERFDTWYQEDDSSQVKNILPGMRNFYKIITGES